MTIENLTSMPVIWHPDCVRHEPDGEVWLGVWDTGTEVPERATTMLEAVRSAGAEITPATAHDDAAVLAVHDAALVEHLATVWADWGAGGYLSQHGRRRVVPYVFPTDGLLAGQLLRSPAGLHGRVGRFCYDTMTLIGPGTWEAARGAADAALTAVDLVKTGAPAAYALCRPPGHHATRTAHGGSCYLNNAAIAAQALREQGAARVAVIDIDAHHANGTQTIFYERSDVYVGSVHVDPGAGWFPHYLGYADERGSANGLHHNRNIPLAPGTGDAPWLAAIDALCTDVCATGAEVIVLSLGLDAAASDPESPLQVSVEGYRAAAEQIAGLGPTVVIQEGGYDLATIGELLLAALVGVQAGQA